ncbi:MAG: DUF177 domain-containing protein [Candidatus Omnitrophota bacterium]
MMKIRVSQILLEGLELSEEVSPKEWDLETEEIKFFTPVKVTAEVYRIVNVVSMDVNVTGQFSVKCSRCLDEVKCNIDKKLKLNYQVASKDQIIDIDPDIREEIILEYPLKPLCRPDCKGLCHKCGKSLNEGGCNCAIT